MRAVVILALASVAALAHAASIAHCATETTNYFEDLCACVAYSCDACFTCGDDYVTVNATSCTAPSCQAKSCCVPCYAPRTVCSVCEGGYVRSDDWLACLPTQCSQSPCVPFAVCVDDPGTGYMCTECQAGYYGNASLLCSPCSCENGECDSETGTCACHSGWTGDDCSIAVCGDGLIVGNEECDDGNTDSGDCCSSTCRAETAGAPCAEGQGDGNICTHDQCDGLGHCALFPSTGSCACGNNVTEPGEECDGGVSPMLACTYGLASCTVCNASCMLVPGLTSLCGDGRVDADAGESCDDGNASSGDGCSAVCTIEQRYVCAPTGGPCTAIPFATSTSITAVTPSKWAANDVGRTFVVEGAFPSPLTWVSLVPHGAACTVGQSFAVANEQPLVLAAQLAHAGAYDVCLSMDAKVSWERQVLPQLEILPAPATTSSITALTPSLVVAAPAGNVIAVTGGMPSNHSLIAFTLDGDCDALPEGSKCAFRLSQLQGCPFTKGGLYFTCYSTNGGTHFVRQAVTLTVIPPAASPSSVTHLSPNSTTAGVDFLLTLHGAMPSPNTTAALMSASHEGGCFPDRFVRTLPYGAHGVTVTAFTKCGNYSICLSTNGGAFVRQTVEPLIILPPSANATTVDRVTPATVMRGSGLPLVLTLHGAWPSGSTWFAFVKRQGGDCAQRGTLLCQTALQSDTATLSAEAVDALPDGELALCLSTDGGATFVRQLRADSVLSVKPPAGDHGASTVDTTAAIIGGVVGGAVAVALGVLLVVLIHRRRRVMQQLQVLVDLAPVKGESQVHEEFNELYEPEKSYGRRDSST